MNNCAETDSDHSVSPAGLSFYGDPMSLMELASEPEIDLVAIDRSRNCRRRYGIRRSADLFGYQIIDVTWGRIGSRGQARRMSVKSSEEAISAVRGLLARRETAPKRFGVPYVSAGDSVGINLKYK